MLFAVYAQFIRDLCGYAVYFMRFILCGLFGLFYAVYSVYSVYFVYSIYSVYSFLYSTLLLFCSRFLESTPIQLQGKFKTAVQVTSLCVSLSPLFSFPPLSSLSSLSPSLFLPLSLLISFYLFFFILPLFLLF